MSQAFIVRPAVGVISQAPPPARALALGESQRRCQRNSGHSAEPREAFARTTRAAAALGFTAGALAARGSARANDANGRGGTSRLAKWCRRKASAPVAGVAAVLARGGVASTGAAYAAPASAMRAAGADAATPSENEALVFVKPHACTPAALEFVPSFLEEHGIAISRRGSVTANEIDNAGIIDSHYAAIARVGMTRDVGSLGLEDAQIAKFLDGYGVSFEEAIDAGAVHSAATALEILEVTPNELLDRCLAAGYVKMGSGLYCAKLEGPPDGPKDIYVLNGFYARMREKFTGSGAVVHWFVVRFDSSVLPWRTFRNSVIGSTNPADSAEGSLRAAFRERWQDLGLASEPNYQDNGVHASAGPLEALRERQIWLGDDPAVDGFGAAVAKLANCELAELLANPNLDIEGRSGSAFDLLEDTDADEALRLLGSCSMCTSR